MFTKVRSAQSVQVSSARLGVTMYDLQLQKIITPSSELRFGSETFS